MLTVRRMMRASLAGSTIHRCKSAKYVYIMLYTKLSKQTYLCHSMACTEHYIDAISQKTYGRIPTVSDAQTSLQTHASDVLPSRRAAKAQLQVYQNAGSQQPAADTQATPDLPPGLEAYSSRGPYGQGGRCQSGSVSFFPFSRGPGERYI